MSVDGLDGKLHRLIIISRRPCMGVFVNLITEQLFHLKPQVITEFTQRRRPTVFFCAWQDAEDPPNSVAYGSRFEYCSPN